MKKGLKSLIFGVTLFVIGGIVAPVVLVFYLLANQSEDEAFVVPGAHTVKVEEAGKYYIWNDYQTIYDGKSYQRSETVPDGVLIQITDELGNRMVLHSDTGTTSSVNDYAKNSIGYVEVARPGELSIEVTGDVESRVFSFGQSNVLKMIGMIFGIFGACFLFAIVGIIFGVLGMVKMLKKK